jgi:hypothetical protein
MPLLLVGIINGDMETVARHLEQQTKAIQETGPL